MFGFGGNKTNSPLPTRSDTKKPLLLSAGGEIDGMVSALVGAACDPDETVRTAITTSLYDIGFRQPGLVLSSCYEFLTKNQKADRAHRVILLKLIHQVLEEKRDEIPEEFGFKLIELVVNEMTREKDVVPDWQQAASSVLVSLGMRFPNQIMEELLKRFEVGTLPHYFVMKTLGDFVSANAVATVPRLREVLSRMLPVLASIKHENTKWVFAASMGHFCEAVLHYVANIDQGTDKTLTATSFSSDMYPAYELMFTKWLSSNEPKVRLATVQATGSMFAVLTREQFEVQVPKIIPTVVGMYRKEKDLLPITQALCSVLDVGVRGGGGFKGVLEPLLPPILNTIHPLVCMPPDYSNSSALKNYNELLRCFEIIGRGYSDVLIAFLLGRLEQRDARIRTGALGVIRHLVTRLTKELEDKKGLLVSGVKPLVTNETVNSVKKALAQVVIAMASHEYLLLEGGESLVEFIIRGSAIEEDLKKAKNTDPDPVSDAEIRNMCDNILNLITTTIPAMEPVLWPYMFEAVVPAEFSGATAVVCKCITYVASIKRADEDDDYIIDFDRAVNLPKPAAIIARLFVQLTQPFRRNQAGIRILECMKAIGPILHPSLPALWDATLPKMIQYLEDNTGSDKWSKDAWEELVMRLLTESIKIANDDEWNVALGTALADQVDFYKGKDPELKRATYKQLGLVMQKSGHKEFIRTKLDSMFASVDHTNVLESDGCASAFGSCAATHLDIVLEKLQVLSKQYFGKKSGGLFKFGGGGKAGGAGKKVKNTILLSLGYITSMAQPNLVTSRVEVHVLNPIKQFLPTLKSPGKKLSSVKMINLIGKAMHPSHLKTEFVFKLRDELLRVIMGYISPTNPALSNMAVRVQVLSTAATLALLEPPLPVELETSLITTALNLYNQPVDPADGPLWDALNEMLAALLFSQTNIACMCRLLKHLENWMRAKEPHQRERAIAATLNIIKKFIEYTSTEDKEDKLFTNLGSAVGLLVPRCTDPIEGIRKSSMEGIQLLLYIDYMLKNSSGKQPVKPPEQLQPITGLRERISTKETNEQFGIVHEMSRVLASNVLMSKEELPNLLHTAVLGLTDPQATSTNGTCVVLNGLIKQRGDELQAYIASLIGGFLQAMEGITSDATMNGTLHALRNLGLHHLLPVLDNLLTAPMPHSPQVVKAFQVLAKDRTLVMPLINHLTDIINNKMPYEEKPDPKNKKTGLKVPDTISMAATCALGEVMQTEELEEVIAAHYPQFLASLLLRFGTSNLNQPKTLDPPASNPKAKPTIVSPSQQTVASFKSFIECGKDTTLTAAMETNNNWARLEQAEYDVTISEIVAAVCKAHPDQMRGIFEFLLPYLRGNYIPQRVVTAAVFAEFLNFCQSDKELLQKLVNSLLGAIVDMNVKLLALKGLSNIVANGPDQTNRYAPTIIDMLVSSIDDQDEVIAMESMLGLSKVFEAVDESRVAPILVNICHRIRPAFEKTNDAIRAAAFTLFGVLWRFGQDSAADVFYEQIHSNLPSIVLHINDESNKVQNACKIALKQLGPLMRAEDVNALLAKKLDVDRSVDYDEFLNELSKLLILNYLERINYYVMTNIDFHKSQWNVLKANAASFTGFLLGNLPAEKRNNINMNPSLISRALIGLLSEKSNIVRKKAAEAMSLLHTY